MISASLGLFGLSNPCVTSLSCSLMIFDSLGVVWAVESIHDPRQHFVDDL